MISRHYGSVRRRVVVGVGVVDLGKGFPCVCFVREVSALLALCCYYTFGVFYRSFIHMLLLMWVVQYKRPYSSQGPSQKNNDGNVMLL